MALVLDGNGDITGLTAGALPSNVIGAGGILQVVSATYSTYTTTTSTSYIDTGLTVNITPTSASSKVLILVNMASTSKNLQNGAAAFQLVRNSTSIVEFERMAGYNGTTSEIGVGASSTSYLDSPATTSSTTYKVQFCGIGAAGVSARFNNYAADYAPVSTIIVMEVAA